MAVAKCYLCGLEASANAGKLVDVTSLLPAHETCFCAHQCQNVLLTGREEAAPTRNTKWRYNWKQNAPKFVKQEIAEAALILLIRSEHKEMSTSTREVDPQLLQHLRSTAREGFAAFASLAVA